MLVAMRSRCLSWLVVYCEDAKSEICNYAVLCECFREDIQRTLGRPAAQEEGGIAENVSIGI